VGKVAHYEAEGLDQYGKAEEGGRTNKGKGLEASVALMMINSDRKKLVKYKRRCPEFIESVKGTNS